MTHTENLRWGILGPGSIAQEFTEDLVANGFTVTAVGSRDQSRADEFARRHGIPAAYGSYEALVADPNVDIVYIATPHPFHAPNTELALNNGKHVLLEKPFTVTTAEAERLAALAAEKKLFLMEGMWTRFLPHMKRIRELVELGTLGSVRTVISDHTWLLPDWKMARVGRPEMAGGALLEMGVYPIALAFDVFGYPDSVDAIGTLTESGVDAQTSLLLKYSEGQHAVINFALDARGPNTAVIVGTRGRIEIESVWWRPSRFRVYDADGVVIEEFDGSVSGHGMQFEAWEAEQRIHAGQIESGLLPVRESVEMMRVLDEIRRQVGVEYPLP
jgi:predicted dehydrogenase